MGNTFRYNERVTPNELGDGRIVFDPEAWGVMYVTSDGRDPGGDFAASADYTVDKNGRRFTFGEPKLVSLDEIKFPFRVRPSVELAYGPATTPPTASDETPEPQQTLFS